MNISDEIAGRYELEAKVRAHIEELVVEVTSELNRRHLFHLNAHPKVELGLGAKGMKSWRAIAQLFFNGFREDAETLLRSLVDVVVDMRFISLDPEERAQRFVDYRVAHRLRWLREAKERGLVGPEEIARAESVIGRDSSEVLARRPEWEKRLPLSWSDANTKDKVDAIDDSMFYLTFMNGSSYTHPNIAGVRHYFARREGAVQVQTEPRVPEEPRVFIDACVYLQVLLEHLNTVMHLEIDERCKKSRAAVEGLVRNRYPDAGKAADDRARQFSEKRE